MRPISALFIVLLLLTACGKKGPLYLPDQNQSVPTQSTPAK
jgi:predicted small lipoprotein YifL